VQVWNAATAKRIITYRDHTGTVEAPAWSPDGTRLALGSWDTTVQIWEATTGQHLFTYHGQQDDIAAVAWSPDGERIASATDDVRVWQTS